jgi:hydrogenase maturation factor
MSLRGFYEESKSSRMKALFATKGNPKKKLGTCHFISRGECRAFAQAHAAEECRWTLS